MKTNIVAVLKDPEYGSKFRKRTYSPNSEWQWGMGEDGKLYCRDDAPLSILTGQWFLAESLQLNIDLDVVKRLSRWTSSLVIKGSLSAALDRAAMENTA